MEDLDGASLEGDSLEGGTLEGDSLEGVTAKLPEDISMDFELHRPLIERLSTECESCSA